jgi:uncharacterized protein YeaO (DUF488 family)
VETSPGTGGTDRRGDGVRLGRVYDAVGPAPELRVLVDRVWPRGLKKEDLALHSWPKDLAPSTELRRWYGHRPERFEEFRRRYLQELAEPEAARALAGLVELAAQHRVVLLTATRDVEHSQAAVLAAVVARSPA